MNEIGSENYLLAKETERASTEMFKLAIRFAENNDSVLYINSKPFKQLPSAEQHEKDILKRIIFMYFQDVHKLIAKLLEIHSWTLSPRLIIVDNLHEYLYKDETNVEIDAYALLISALFNCMQYLTRKLGGQCISVVSVDSSQWDNVKLETLVDLYYYKTAIESLDHILPK